MIGVGLSLVEVSTRKAGGGTPGPVVPTNRIRNTTNTGYVRSLSGGYSTFGVPTYA